MSYIFSKLASGHQSTAGFKWQDDPEVPLPSQGRNIPLKSELAHCYAGGPNTHPCLAPLSD